MIETNQAIIKPRRLKPGDVIGIAAPAGPYEKKIFDKGVAVIKEMGFEVMLPNNLQQPDRFLAGSDAHRASVLMNLSGGDVDAIICARGGYGSMRILEGLDFDRIRRHPKVFVGFSDISALLSTIETRSGLVVFHGPVVTSLGSASPQTKASFLQAVTSDQPLVVHPTNPVLICPGKGRGVVTGGNLATLCHLLGTPFSPTYKDCIVLLEDTDEVPYKFDRMLFQMKLAGCFEGMAGMILGSFHDSGKYEAVCDVVERIFGGMDIPILGGFAIGHDPDNMTIPMGIRATLDTDLGSLVYHDVATSL
jgi:muramoyltetrapeptide carboxypeptidase